MPDTRDLTAVIDDSGYPIGMRTMGRPPVFVGHQLVLLQDPARTIHTGTTAATVLRTYTVPGGLIGQNGSLGIRLDCEMTNSANMKTIELLLGGVVVSTINRTASASEMLEWEFWNRNNSEANQWGAVRTGQGVASLGNSLINTAADFDVVIRCTLALAAENITLNRLLVFARPSE